MSDVSTPEFEAPESGAPEYVVPYERGYRSPVRMPWDLGRPSPFVVRLYEEGWFDGTVLDAGCGTGQNAVYLAERGYRVIAVDAAPTALRRARQLAAARGVSVEFSDVDLRQLPGIESRVDTVVDTGMLHILSATDQLRYTAALHRACRPGGVAHIFTMNDNHRNWHETHPDWERVHRWSPTGGKQGVPESEIREVFATGWRMESLAETSMTVDVPHVGQRERHFWLARLRRL